MMENRSFDHFLRWHEGADGRQAGLRYADAQGRVHRTYHLAPDYQGCGHPDPDHSYEGGRIEYNNGACDGWLRAGENDEYAIGYYTKKDLAFLWPCTFLALWGGAYISIARPFFAFLADAAVGTLPHVSFVEPRFLGEELGLSHDDHPFADIRNGQAFLNLVYSAVTTSPAWSKTVLVINYDCWGGFFDHVPPTAAPIPPADQAAGNQDGLRGFRLPALVVSPFARREYVSSLELDHTSVLRMIEWRWNLAPLTVRDETANNLADVMDFSAPNISARRFNVPAGPFGSACLNPPSEFAEWFPLLEMAADFGWPVALPVP